MADNLSDWVWLSSIPQIGALKGKKLLEHFGGPRGVWEADFLDLKGLGFLTPSNIKSIKDKKNRILAERHYENLYRHGIKAINLLDKSYPEYLKNIYDPPIVLYSKGKIYGEEKMIAVVGSRKASYYGLDVAKTISRELADCGITIVSGMARGVDSYSHKGALEAGGRTIAVLGCGLDTVYPKENEALMKQIAGCGAVLSEYLPGVAPLSRNFPARNRIISGLSLGVVVIEASNNSGSLITADFALEQGREVFAVPGNLDSLTSKGTNKLIKDGAKMVTSIDDIIEELHLYFNSEQIIKKENCKAGQCKKYNDVGDEELVLIDNLKQGPMYVDLLAEKCGYTIQTINYLVTMLELKGIVRQAPGKIISLS